VAMVVAVLLILKPTLLTRVNKISCLNLTIQTKFGTIKS